MENEELKIVTLTEENIDEEHICCAIGNDKLNTGRAKLKKEWLKERFRDGHIFKKYDIRGKAFIEYVPAENAWSPIEAPGYMFIHCFWVSGRYKAKGLGTRLLQECINDSKGKNGVCIVTSKKNMPFLTDKSFFIRNGFEVCDTALRYFELLVKRWGDAPLPKFRENARKGIHENRDGLTIIYSDQCPFGNDFADEMIEVATKRNIPGKKLKIRTKDDAQGVPSATALFSVFYNGDFLTHEIMTQKKFDKLLSKYA